LVKPDDDLRRSIGIAARAARMSLRMTQAEVANAVDVVPEVYGRIERGMLMPSVPTLVAIAKALRVSPADLLGWPPTNEAKRSAGYERVLALLDRLGERELKRARAVLDATFATHEETED
jgi:transcriptional regulator with XRE-family HTH domain